MFGSFFHKYGEMLGGEERDKEWFASHLAAEVLNRARVVELAFDHYQESGGDAALGALSVALEHFSDDCDEARVRGRRARLFAGVRKDNWVDADSIETDEQLEVIGGAYEPLRVRHARELAEARKQANLETQEPDIAELVPAMPYHFAEKFDAARRFALQLEAAGAEDQVVKNLLGSIDDARTSLQVLTEDRNDE